VPVELTCRTVSGRRYAGNLRADALTLLGILALEHYELSLMLVGDSGIRRLNREFRGKDQATDVLSFPQLDTARELRRSGPSTRNAPPVALGDIVISIDTARRQARELRQGVAARVRTLLIHGILHLMGSDHERSAAEARRMFAREHELAALIQTGSLQAETTDDAGGRGPRSHPGKVGVAASARPGKDPNEAIDARWSPAAMPERSAKAATKSAGKPKARAKAAARILSSS
jgi:probable rRNA maturation factor